MIRNQWYAVLESRELVARPVGRVRLGERLVSRLDGTGRAACFYDRCAYRGASLAIGRCIEDRIRRPFHGLWYDVIGWVHANPGQRSRRSCA